jgi:hypothetical protein
LLLVAASVAFSFALACAMPFAALCAVAACTLPRRDAFYVAGAAWMTNQVIGFSFLHYPWTADCLARGVAIGLSALLCTLVADWVRRRLIRWHPLVNCVVAYGAAFACFEAALATSAVMLGGLEDFTPHIVATIFGINTIAWVAFLALSWIGTFVGVAQPSLSLARMTR